MLGVVGLRVGWVQCGLRPVCLVPACWRGWHCWDLLRGWRLVLHVAQFTHTGVAWCWWLGYA